MVFSEPVFGGEWVNFDATVISAGNTSITIKVSVRAENASGNARDVCEAIFTMVAVKKGDGDRWVKVAHGKSFN